ncbi:MAG TPA: AAA family ATPase [Corynebacteriales bacterium]|nr:AAA family ATPase [Mycobacteriales bacterium]
MIYGVNGSGKTTICRLLDKNPEIVNFTKTDTKTDKKEKFPLYIFDQNYVNNAQEFLEGNGADGITLILGEENTAAKREIVKISKKLQDCESELSEINSKLKNNSQDVKKIIEAISNDLESKKISELTPSRFNRREKIKFLEKEEQLKSLENEEIRRLLSQLRTKEIRLKKLPSLPDLHLLTEEQVELILKPQNQREVESSSLIEWLEKGVELHAESKKCKFCTGNLTETRILELEGILALPRENIKNAIKKVVNELREQHNHLNNWVSEFNGLENPTLVMDEEWEASQNRVVASAEELRNKLWKCWEAAGKRSDDLTSNKIEMPALSVDEWGEVKQHYDDFSDIYYAVKKKIDKEVNLREDSLRSLKESACSRYQERYRLLRSQREQLEKDKNNFEKEKSCLERQKLEKEGEISSTVEISQRINQQLAVITGSERLQIRLYDDGKSYRVMRRDEPAENMSNGEKKLIAFLYFCFQLLDGCEKKNTGKCLILLDDVISEIDSTRALMIDIFITQFFSEYVPNATILFLTHSNLHFRYLAEKQLRKLIRKKKPKSPKTSKKNDEHTGFYVLRRTPCADSADGLTVINPLPKELLIKPTEYLLSMWFLLTNELRRIENKPLDYGIGNQARKVVEGYLSFRLPGEEHILDQIEYIDKQYGQGDGTKKFSSAIFKKLLNESSHLENEKSAEFLEIDSSRILQEVMKFFHAVDEVHIDQMMKRLLPAEKHELLKKMYSRTSFS